MLSALHCFCTDSHFPKKDEYEFRESKKKKEDRKIQIHTHRWPTTADQRCDGSGWKIWYERSRSYSLERKTLARSRGRAIYLSECRQKVAGINISKWDWVDISTWRREKTELLKSRLCSQNSLPWTQQPLRLTTHKISQSNGDTWMCYMNMCFSWVNLFFMTSTQPTKCEIQPLRDIGTGLPRQQRG